MTCPHDCFCHVEGDRGLEGEGAGSALNPFVIEPAEGRTIPRTAATAAALPILAAEEDGQLAWVTDSSLLYAWTGTDWQVVAPQWQQVFPTDLDVGTVGSGGTAATTEHLELEGPSRWSVHAKGFVYAQMEAPDATGLGSAGVVTTTASVSVRLHDIVTDAFYDRTNATITNSSYRLPTGEILGDTKEYEVPFALQQLLFVPAGTTLELNITGEWEPFGLDDWGDMELRRINIFATRVQNFDNTV